MFRKLRISCDWIRGYRFGDPARNGEYRFLRSYIADGMVVFDVGAHIGDSTDYVLSLGRNLEVHCFEPAPAAYAALVRRFTDHPRAKQVRFNNVGLSDSSGITTMKIYGDLAGCNSLYERRFSFPSLTPLREEVVVLIALDQYLSDKAIPHIHLLKIDVEGHEFKVLQGASSALQAGRIDCVQFEYGGSFLDAGLKLEDIYKLLSRYGYHLFRLFPFGRIPVRAFSPKLENYQHSNWIATRI